MKFVTLFTTAILIASTNADTLTQQAKQAGLIPIPASNKQLIKLVDDPKNPITDAKVELGKKLYFDPRLSKSALISCNTCHNLGAGGGDGLEATVGHKWTIHPKHLNSPTVYNSVFNTVQLWDGRSPNLTAQAKGAIKSEAVMAASEKLVVERITSIPAYVEEFKKAYGKDVVIDFHLITDTIAVFERTLVTPSRFDAFMLGKENALTAAEKAGLKTFIDKGCASCHNGIGFGGTMQPFQITGTYKFSNVGSFKGDKEGKVKTPLLRNIAQTAPYFHNGKIWSLKEAIKEMGRIQVGIELSDDETASIETFLKSLTGKKPNIVYPTLPDSTELTPKPDVL